MGDSQAPCHKLKLMVDDTEMRVNINVNKCAVARN